MVGVAQLVELQIVVLAVAGSSPVAHPSLSGHRVIEIFCRGVAQLVAHSLWERGVASSSLAAPTIFQHKQQGFAPVAQLDRATDF